MRYEYANEAGERLIIEQPMNDKHPDALQIHPRGSMTATDGDGRSLRVRPCKPSAKHAFARVMGDVSINAHPCTGKFPYVSRSLGPGIAKHLAPERDGRGLPVIRNREQERAIAKETGFVKEA